MEYADLRAKLATEVETRTVPYDDVQYEATSGSSILKVKGDSYPMEEEAEAGLFKELSIPMKYIERCPVGLKEENMNYWMGQKLDQDTKLVLSDGKVHGMISPEAVYVQPTEIFDRVFETLGERGLNSDIKRYNNKGSIWMLEVVSEGSRRVLGDKDGDVYYGGLAAIYSDVLTTNPRVDSYWWREICSNGMRANEGHRRFRFVGKKAEDVLCGVGVAVNQALSYIDVMAAQIELLRKKPVEDFEATVARLLRDFKLPKKYEEIIADAYLVEPGDTYEHLINALTRAANLTDDENIRLNLQTAAGHVVQDTKTRCSKCFNILAN